MGTVTVNQVPLLSSLARKGDGGTERVRNLSKGTQSACAVGSTGHAFKPDSRTLRGRAEQRVTRPERKRETKAH